MHVVRVGEERHPVDEAHANRQAALRRMTAPLAQREGDCEVDGEGACGRKMRKGNLVRRDALQGDAVVELSFSDG